MRTCQKPPKCQRQPLKINVDFSPNKSLASSFQTSPSRTPNHPASRALGTPSQSPSPSPSPRKESASTRCTLCPTCANSAAIMKEIKQVMQEIMKELRDQVDSETWYHSGVKSGITSQLRFILKLIKERHISGRSPAKGKLGTISRTPRSIAGCTTEKENSKPKLSTTSRTTPSGRMQSPKLGSTTAKESVPQPRPQFSLPKATPREESKKTNSDADQDQSRQYMLLDYTKSVKLVQRFLNSHKTQFPQATSRASQIVDSRSMLLLGNLLDEVKLFLVY